MNQAFLGLFLAADFAFFLWIYHSAVPWFSLLGAAVGLSVIVLCWAGKKYTAFVITLLVCAVVHTITYNWSSIFNLH